MRPGRGTRRPVSLEEIRRISAAIPVGRWTTYQDVGELVYGHRKAMQAVGDLLGRAGDVEGAHRILRDGGRISEAWHRTDGGPEQCRRLLRAERAWDDARGRADRDCYLDAAALRRHLADRGPTLEQ
jgi:alkylated DNA nucleotide flippase Atl1